VNDSTWTLIAGDFTPQPPEYGSIGIPNITNLPGPRKGAAGWYDSLRQELWLFGGDGNGRGTSLGT